VCTRNRPAALGRALRSLLEGAGSNLEVLVIDQSDNEETKRAVEAVADPRVRYVRSDARGKGAALNEGLRLALGDIVVCTDDDCEAPPGWIEAMAGLFEGRPHVVLAFCNVLPVDHDRGAGYIPAYIRSENRLLRAIHHICKGHGLGAGMAVRRYTVLDMGGFDESFGPGGRFPSADDWDIAHRVLLKGWQVYESAELAVRHDGFRTFFEGREHARRDWTAIGAACAKPLRAGYQAALVVALWEFFGNAVWPPFGHLLKLRRPQGLVRIVAFARGFAAGIRTPVDRTTLLFSRGRST
jgi:glycosyltransferase involved in cell wall biosynthesis